MIDTELSGRYRSQCTTLMGAAGTKALRRATAAVVGCGALGSMVAMQLAGAGIGRLMLADFDTVDISNLQRQFFFTESQAGALKAEILARRVKDLNSEVEVTVKAEAVTQAKAPCLLAGADVIVDCTDNPASKLMLSAAADALQTAVVHGGVEGFRGQVMTHVAGSPSYGELFPEAVSSSFMPCGVGGVAGPAAVLTAAVQASEVMKLISGIGEPLTGALWTADLLTNDFRVWDFNT